MTPEIIYSIGHSTRSIQDFLRILQKFEIRTLADIRTIPKSKRNPQFTDVNLSIALIEAGIAYEKIPNLGGLRKPRPDSQNLGWHNESFRGYADYMQSGEFVAGLQKLLSFAIGRPTVMMCAEAVPWRCHRSLIGDALVLRGVKVIDIINISSARPHKLSNFAVVDGLRITYPVQDGTLGDQTESRTN
jgi:uncharacterized protein (DUF488 family)